jgi:hypothetical protein
MEHHPEGRSSRNLPILPPGRNRGDDDHDDDSSCPARGCLCWAVGKVHFQKKRTRRDRYDDSQARRAALRHLSLASSSSSSSSLGASPRPTTSSPTTRDAAPTLPPPPPSPSLWITTWSRNVIHRDQYPRSSVYIDRSSPANRRAGPRPDSPVPFPPRQGAPRLAPVQEGSGNDGAAPAPAGASDVRGAGFEVGTHRNEEAADPDVVNY